LFQPAIRALYSAPLLNLGKMEASSDGYLCYVDITEGTPAL
jgi:hypothetical protein